MSRGMWRGVVPRAGCCSSAPRTISCPWPTTRRRSTGRWRYCKRCSEQPTDLGSFAETRHRTAPRPDLPSTSSLPLRLPSEGPACGFAQGLAPTHCPTEASNRDPPAQAALGLLPHGDPGPAGRRTGDSHQWAGARHARVAGRAIGPFADVRRSGRRHVQPDPGDLALPERRSRGQERVSPHRTGGRILARSLERGRSEEHTSELQSRLHLVCRLLLEKKKKSTQRITVWICFSRILDCNVVSYAFPNTKQARGSDRSRCS